MSNYIPNEFSDTLARPIEPGAVLARPIEPGEVLCRRYRVERELGRGGMGIVLLATDTTLNNRPVALKVLPHLLARDRRSIARLKIEAEKNLELTHPHIVRLINFEQDAHRPGGEVAFLVMHYVAGRTLNDLLADHPHGLPWERVRVWAEQVASAIDYAHTREILHRDIKPSNILIDRGGEGDAYLMDFGLARQVRESLSRVTGRFADGSGTLPYMSPQQLDGKESKSNDIYSFAMTLYEALSGEVAFRSMGDAHVLMNQIRHVEPPVLRAAPLNVCSAVRAGLSKSADDRPESCMALLRKAIQHGAEGRSPGDVLTLMVGSFRNVEMRFRWIPSGSFLMGSPNTEPGRDTDEGPQRTVTIENGFYLQETPLTQEQWKAVQGLDRNPSLWKSSGDRVPVERVSWDDAQAFIEGLNRDPALDKASVSARLPSEAEWEYACRAGTTTPFFFGEVLNRDLAKYDWDDDVLEWPWELPDDFPTRPGVRWENLEPEHQLTEEEEWDEQARYEREILPTQPVGMYPPNAWGLHDMHGLVWEWCEDMYDSYERAPANGDPATRPMRRVLRVKRGGCGVGAMRDLRSARRCARPQSDRDSHTGFRILLEHRRP